MGHGLDNPKPAIKHGNELPTPSCQTLLLTVAQICHASFCLCTSYALLHKGLMLVNRHRTAKTHSSPFFSESPGVPVPNSISVPVCTCLHDSAGLLPCNELAGRLPLARATLCSVRTGILGASVDSVQHAVKPLPEYLYVSVRLCSPPCSPNLRIRECSQNRSSAGGSANARNYTVMAPDLKVPQDKKPPLAIWD